MNTVAGRSGYYQALGIKPETIKQEPPKANVVSHGSEFQSVVGENSNSEANNPPRSQPIEIYPTSYEKVTDFLLRRNSYNHHPTHKEVESTQRHHEAINRGIISVHEPMKVPSSYVKALSKDNGNSCGVFKFDMYGDDS